VNEAIEKVLNTLDVLRTNDEITYSAYSMLHDEISMLDDLLKEQEPRLLTLEEACVLDVCWLEWRRHGRKPVACRIIMRKDYAGDPMPVVHRFFEEPTGYSKKNYGKDWRCWSAKPTNEQRREAKWGV